jgi:hypothetical protein
MNPLERPNTARIVTSTAALALLAATVCYVLLLVMSAGQIASAPTPSTMTGPLGLFELQKQALSGGGFQASIAIRPASSLFAAFWVLTAAAIVWARLRKTPASS